MQEICQSGSEGGGAGNRSPYPYFIGARKRLLILLFVFRQRDQGLIQIGMFAPCSRRGKTKRKG